MTKKRILLLSAYDARSHQYWHQSLVAQFPQHNWQVLTLKDRFFAWRMGANALNFKAQFDQALQASYDLVIATSMTDLSTLRGLYPNLSGIPTTLYFHENQFAYPVNDKQHGLIEIQLRSIYAALAADQLKFNSNYNQVTFLQGIKTFCKKMPDGLPRNLTEQLAKKSSILPVPIAGDCQPPINKKVSSPDTQVVWNHRWEHDKGPDTLLELLRLCNNNTQLKFHIIGQQFRTMPAAMQQIIKHHQDQCLTIGYIESRAQYIETLQQADVVLSTAVHDFQGLAMLEAAACGCLPIAPNRLVYPEIYPSTNLYPSTPQDSMKEVQVILHMLENLHQLQPAQTPFTWQQLQPHYEQLLE